MRIVADYICVDLKRRKVHSMNPEISTPHFEEMGAAIGILCEKISPYIKMVDDECSKVLTRERLNKLTGEIELPEDTNGHQFQCRVANALRCLNINSYEDLTKTTVSDLLKSRNMGEGSITYLRNHLKDLGLNLKE